MGLWTKGIKRSQSGELRLEQDMSNLIRFTVMFLYRFFNGKDTGSVTISDSIMYVQLGKYGSRTKLKERSHVGMMKCLLECVDNILIHTRDVQIFFTLQEKIQRNLNKYEETHVLKDLYI